MGRGKRQRTTGARAQLAGSKSAAAQKGPSGKPLVAVGQGVHRQEFAKTPIAGYDLEEDWARKVRVEPKLAELIDRFQLAFPQLSERLPVMARDGSYAHFSNEKARWFYRNRPDELRWEHESASEYVLSPEHECLVHSREVQGRHRIWYRYPDGTQFYYEGPPKQELQVLEIKPSGDVFTADGWRRGRTPDGRPRPLAEDGATDIHRDGRREWRAALYKKGEQLPNELHPLHREHGPAVVTASGEEHWRRGRRAAA